MQTKVIPIMEKLNGSELAKIFFVLLSNNKINKISFQKFESLIIIATRLLGKDYMNGKWKRKNLHYN